MSVTLAYGPRLVDNCDAIWTANASVTASLEATIKKEGVSAAKLAVAAGFATGVAAYKAITSLDMSYATQIRFWIRSSINQASGDLRFLIDDTAACVSPLETLTIGALTANTWSQQTLTFATPAALTAVIALGLRVHVDNGACDIYIDKIELVLETRTFNELHVVGFDNPETERGWPFSETIRLLDAASHREKPVARFRDNIVVDLEVTQKSMGEMVFLNNFAEQYDVQYITYGGETLQTDTMTWSVVRDNGIRLSKHYTFVLTEKTARAPNVLPSSYV